MGDFIEITGYYHNDNPNSEVHIKVFSDRIFIKAKDHTSWFIAFTSITKCQTGFFFTNKTSFLKFSTTSNSNSTFELSDTTFWTKADEFKVVNDYEIIEQRINSHLASLASLSSRLDIVDAIRTTIAELAFTPVTGSQFRATQKNVIETHGMSE
jgi:hypothetical protein